MSTINRLLVPTDFSEDAGYALKVAADIARRKGAEVDLLYVVPSLQHFLRFLSSDMESEYANTLNEQAESRLEELALQLKEENRGDRFVLFDKKPGEAVLDQIQAGDYDLVVIGSKGSDQTKLGRGSTAQYIIRGSHVPVLSVDRLLSDKTVNHIMDPTDGSALSFAALSPAVVMADIWNADILLYYVHELRGGLIENLYTSSEDVQKERVYKKLLNKLDEFMKKYKEGGLSLERGEKQYHDRIFLSDNGESASVELITDVKTGYSSHYEIERYAEKHADLVVMGTHGYSGFAHIMLGSVTEKVIQHLKKPVLTVRPYESDFLLSESGIEEEDKTGSTPIPPWHWV
jgi:nucleotide-binding universal stress UspA family protein